MRKKPPEKRAGGTYQSTERTEHGKEECKMEYIPEIGIRAHDLKANTPAALREQAEKLQVKYVQLALRKSFTGIHWTNHTFSVGLAEKIKAELGGLRVSVLGSYINLLAEGEALEREKETFRQNLLFAKYLGAGMVGTETGTSDHSEADYQKVLKAVRELADTAEKLGVMIGIEGVWAHTINTPEAMRRLLDEVNSPNVMTILDPINYLNDSNYQQQDEIISAAFELLADKIMAIHVKDFRVEDGKMQPAQIGTGQLNMALLFDYIRTKKPWIDILLEQSSMELFPADRAAILKAAGCIV